MLPGPSKKSCSIGRKCKLVSDKPSTENGYFLEDLKLIRRTCLYAATRLGDLREDMVVVGGLVPSLLIDGDQPENEYKSVLSRHVGTLDLDIGLSLGLLDTGRYKKFAKRLREAGFRNDVKESGEKRTHRWVIEMEGRRIELDFLVSKSDEQDKGGGEILNIEGDFSAIVTPGLHLAFEDYERIELRERIPGKGKAKREIKVAGPAAFLILKSLAFDLRGTNKDAYDLYYVLRNYPGGTEEIAQRFNNFKKGGVVASSLDILKRDFRNEDMIGPQSVANFVASNEQNTEIRADIVAFINDFLKKL